MMRSPAWFVVLLVMILTQGCGYHLRGQRPPVKAAAGENIQSTTTAASLESIHITAAAASQLGAAVTTQLTDSGVTITDTREGADYALSLHSEEFARQVLSVSPETGKVEEYQVIFSCHISIRKAGELVADQVIRVSGDYAFDEDAALGKFAEEETIREELIEQAAAQIIRRLNTLTK